MTTLKLTPKMHDAYDKINKARRVGYWLTALADMGVNAHSVSALVRRGLVIRQGKYYYDADNVPDSIGESDVWPDGYSLPR